ncbi:MAG: DUF4065 domain-containing protein [Nitrospiraceae bacterium]|nr:DUF4065 domain-containing protein [Nitrospiraceae bacterium]
MDASIHALDVARYFLSKANEEGDLITNLKMQKLLYYAQAWHLVNFDEPLFIDHINAWNLGPVVADVYREFKKFGAGPIVYEATGKESRMFTPSQIEYLDEFYDIFIPVAAHQLVNASHNERPWIDAMKTTWKIITNEDMKSFYSEKLSQSKSAKEAKS